MSNPAPLRPEENPYQSSRGFSEITQAVDGNDEVPSQRVLQYLVQTRPWVRFISILLFLGAALLLVVLVSLGFGVGMVEGTSGLMVFIFLFYTPMCGAYLAGAVLLWRYANQISRFQHERSWATLEEALRTQRLFWASIGVMVIAFIGLYLLAVFGMAFASG